MTFEEWLAGAPEIGAAVAAEWGIELGEPLVHDGATSWVAPAGGAILKVTWPHEEAEHEADALRLWDGDGVVRLLRHDRERWALLIERCVPGAQLASEWTDDLVPLGCALLQRLWRVVDDGPFDAVAALCSRWADVAEARGARLDHGIDPGVVAEAVTLLRTLPRDESILLHQDFHPGNVLSAEREPWLVIDPKPIVGDRGFDTTRLVSQGVHDERHLRERLARVADLTGIDTEHLHRWALARTVEAALWHVERGPGPNTDAWRAGVDLLA